MKRILIALAMLAAAQVADAQSVKTPDAAAKAVDKAVLASQDAKKATKVATWTNLGKAYLDAYNAPVGNAWPGASKQELMLLMGSEKPVTVEDVLVGGTPYTKEIYANKDFYYDQNAVLRIIDVTKPVVEDALGKSLEAYSKAYEVDVKKSKVNDVKEAISMIHQKYASDAYTAYQLGDFKLASHYFSRAAEAMNTAPLSQIDTNSIYNAGFTALAAGDIDLAKAHFEKCLSYNYYYEDGEVYAKLAHIHNQLGDKEAEVATLEEGFAKFPQSQAILIGLINFYRSNNQEPDRLFELIAIAKKNEPNNASLYYVEGEIYKQLGRIEEATNSYYQCAVINPAYEFGYIGAGVMFYDEAVRLSELASTEYDDTKYEALVQQFEKMLENALEPFEKAYEMSKDESLKVNIAEYLKNIYYRFYSKGEQYEAGYNKYNAIVKGAN